MADDDPRTLAELTPNERALLRFWRSLDEARQLAMVKMLQEGPSILDPYMVPVH